MKPGTRLSHFEIVAHLGSGGMGEVYRAIDQELGRQVAIKILPDQAMHDESRITRFVHEAKAASALNHPNIVTVHEIGRVDGVHFLAMELVEGETLRELMSRGAPHRQILGVLAQVADGLEKAHSAGIVHRDLKPENVMVTNEGYAKILDFGLAKLIQSDEPDPDGKTTARNLTRQGVVVGTVGYMSPEQLRGQAIDRRADIFSFGCILYEAFAGRRPFQGASTVDTIHEVLHQTPQPLGDKEMQRVVAKALAKDPRERYQSARELAAELRRLQDVEPGRSTGGRRSKRIYALIAGAAVILSAVFMAARLWHRLEAPPGTGNFDRMSIVPVAGTVGAHEVALSNDGKYLAYTRESSDGTAMMIRQIATGSEATLVAPRAGEDLYPIFSRDGDYVLFNANDTLFRIPVLGGNADKILDHVQGPITFSPDDKRFCFMRRGSLYTANVDGSDITRIAGATSKESFHDPAWSPDPTRVVAVRRSLQGAIRENLQLLHLEGDDPVAGHAAVADDLQGTWTTVTRTAWTPNGDSVIVTAATSFPGPRQLLAVPSSKEVVRRITNDLHSYGSLSLSRDGRTIAAVQTDSRWAIGEYSLQSNRAVRQIDEGSGGFSQLSTAPDGTVAYTIFSGTSVDLSILGPEGRKQLTSSDEDEYLPELSPDGRFIAYISDQGGRRAVWRMDRDGGNRKQLGSGTFQNGPRWFPDGRSILFTSRDIGRPQLMKMASDGGEAVAFPTRFVTRPAPSPDGRTIAAVDADGWKLALIDAASGKTLKETTLAGVGSQLRWTPDGRGVALVRKTNGVENVWLLDVKSEAMEPLTRFDSGRISGFDWGPGGRSIVCAHVTELQRVVLIRGFR